MLAAESLNCVSEPDRSAWPVRPEMIPVPLPMLMELSLLPSSPPRLTFPVMPETETLPAPSPAVLESAPAERDIFPETACPARSSVPPST